MNVSPIIPDSTHLTKVGNQGISVKQYLHKLSSDLDTKMTIFSLSCDFGKYLKIISEMWQIGG